MARPASVLFVWLLCAFGVAAVEQDRPSDRPDLEGHWQLNASLSDDVPLLPGEALALARASGVLPTRGRVSSGGPDPFRVTGVRHLLRGEFGAEQLRIAQENGTLTLAYGDAGPLPVTPDGRKVTLDRSGLRFTVVSQWAPPLLTIERVYEDGTTLRETLATFDDPRQLVATTTILNSRIQPTPVTFQRVFDPDTRQR